MTSPSLTLTPFSNWPTATTSAVCGFSLAVSGSTIPDAVVSSRSTIWTSARSPNGLNLIYLPPGLFGLFYDARTAAGRIRLYRTHAPEIVTASDAPRNYRPSCADNWFFGKAPIACCVTCPDSKRDGRNARNAVVHRCLRVVVHVDLDEIHILASLGHLLEDRGDTPARHTPRRPEIYYDRPIRPQDVALKSRVRYFGNCHYLGPPYSLGSKVRRTF